LAALVVISDTSTAVLVLLVDYPLALFLLWRDRQRRSRDPVAEIAAATFMSCGAVAIVLAGGGTLETAAMLGILIGARSIGAILYVRERVAARRGRAASRTVPIAFHVAALLAAVAIFAAGIVNILAILAFTVLLARTLSRKLPETPAKLGWSEVRSGLAALLLISLSFVI
ncbi:MAG: hypothetical protein R3338_08825, partial [Thermoanaerobaculia bacterium]|nr:hypothetical protein [Thermoanaerobaculia bacterium]